MKLAIAISVYDKFDDVKLIVDIVRNNWEGQFFICVTSTHPDAKQALKDVPVDRVNVIDKIPFSPSFEAKKKRMHLFLRVLDSIQTGCRTCLESGATHTIHIHADAFPFSFEKIEPLLRYMDKNGKAFAYRGSGLGFYCHDAPLGDMDDMFFIVNNQRAKETRLWEFDLFDFLPHKLSIHGILPVLTLSRLGIRELLHYASGENNYHWDGQPASAPPMNSAHPMYYDSRYAFLHIHQEAFPEDWGKKILAYYLSLNHIKNGERVRSFVEKYQTTKNDLVHQLSLIERQLKRFYAVRGLARWLNFYHRRNFSKQMEMIRQYNAMNPVQKMRWVLRTHARQFKLVFPDSTNFHPDIIWPRSVNQVYQQLTSTEINFDVVKEEL